MPNPLDALKKATSIGPAPLSQSSQPLGMGVLPLLPPSIKGSLGTIGKIILKGEETPIPHPATRALMDMLESYKAEPVSSANIHKYLGGKSYSGGGLIPEFMKIRPPEGFVVEESAGRLNPALEALRDQQQGTLKRYRQVQQQTPQADVPKISSLDELGSVTAPAIPTPAQPTPRANISGSTQPARRGAFTKEQVRAIRQMTDTGTPISEVAKMYGKPVETIRSIAKRDSFGWVK